MKKEIKYDAGSGTPDLDGVKSWTIDDQLHRTDGPAVIWPSGTRQWFLNGLIHRLDGPAVVWANGDKYWALNGKLYTSEEEWLKAKLSIN